MPTFLELKYLADRRMEAVDVLNYNGIHDIAYQDSGYIIEFGLKAAICKHLNATKYPDNVEIYRTHHFDTLVDLAGLTSELAKKKASDRTFMKNWSIATKWSVALRYRPIGIDEKSKSTTFINAVKEEKGGVLSWIKTHW